MSGSAPGRAGSSTASPPEPEAGGHASGSEDSAAQFVVSVLVPVSERPENLADIYRTYSESLREGGWRFEFVFALEPYHADRADELSELIEDGEPIEILEAGQAVGEAALVKWAADRSRGEIVVTLPAYYRVLPESVGPLVETVEQDHADMAVARRSPRQDPWINRVQSRVFHFLVRGISGAGLDDLGCGVWAMRREVLEEIPLYGDFFRFFPLLAVSHGYRVEQMDAGQHPRDRNPRVYSPGVYLRRLIDLLGVFFLVRFTYKPLRFFGLVGSGVSLVGMAILAVLFVQRIGGEGIADRPLLLLGVLLVTLGVQAVALGLVGEIIVHLNAPQRPGYRVVDPAEDRE